MRYSLFGLAIAVLPVSAAPIATLAINSESIARLGKRHALASMEVSDPVYKTRKRYQGFLLKDMLQEMGPAPGQNPAAYLRFRCRDGYSPVMPLAKALTARGLVAVRDADASPGTDWRPFGPPGSSTTPAPSYLVWSQVGGSDDYPWPYQMTAIELINASEALGLAVDRNGEAGYRLFTHHCLKCHSMNSSGGTMGPELNSPCSVTEYWNPELLRRFIARPVSVRSASKMPDFSTLAGSELDAIIGYLRAAALKKPAGARCDTAE